MGNEWEKHSKHYWSQESVKRYVEISGEGRGRRTCTYMLLSHICFRAVTCFRLEQVSIAETQEWQTEFIFLSSSYRLCVSWLHGVPQWITPPSSHTIVKSSLESRLLLWYALTRQEEPGREEPRFSSWWPSWTAPRQPAPAVSPRHHKRAS